MNNIIFSLIAYIVNITYEIYSDCKNLNAKPTVKSYSLFGMNSSILKPFNACKLSD